MPLRFSLTSRQRLHLLQRAEGVGVSVENGRKLYHVKGLGASPQHRMTEAPFDVEDRVLVADNFEEVMPKSGELIEGKYA